MPTLKKTYRIDETLAGDVAAIAAESVKSENQVVEEALKLYRDYHYMQAKASFITEELVHILQASYRMAENSINQKTNRVLSELAIQTAIQNHILAASLEVDKVDLNNYRLRAVDFLKQNNRVLRLDELSDE